MILQAEAPTTAPSSLATSRRSSPAHRTGIVLVNVGSPDAPTAEALRPYLREFLSDPFVVDYPRWLWLPLLHGIILRMRPRRSARLYRRIWTDSGSPLLHTLEAQAAGLLSRLANGQGPHTRVEVGLRYGRPSIETALGRLQAAGCTRILAFPLFPQFSSTTTETSLQAVQAVIETWEQPPELRIVRHYPDHPGYIRTLARTILEARDRFGRPDHLIFSFHGIPQRYADRKGDPYPQECRRTAALAARSLGLEQDDWSIAFQSRFGPEPWLRPYTDEHLKSLAHRGAKDVHIVAPGFSADCLETIDELDHEARAGFIEAGGRSFHYIPALNARQDHLDTLAEIARAHLKDWI